MYIPRSYAESEPDALFELLTAHPFGALVTASTDGLFATHLPFVVHRARGAHGTIEAHVARANPHHEQTLIGGEALLIVTGPDAYVTPSWYATKAEHGKVVPTWNYVAVHVYGVLRFTDDDAFLERHLTELVERHEGGRAEPWVITDAPAAFVAQSRKAVVGLELTISRLEGKWKMSQNRSAADIDGVVRGLGASDDARERTVAALVDARRPPR